MSEAARMTPEAEKVWNACFPVPMETAVILQQNTEQLGAYLVQMAQMAVQIAVGMVYLSTPGSTRSLLSDGCAQMAMKNAVTVVAKKL